MPFFGNRVLVDEFEYREILVRIFETVKGGRCCGLDHEPDEVQCQNCGKAIRSKAVMLVCFFNTDVADMTRRPLDSVRRIACKIIDNALDGRGPAADGPGDDKPEAPKKPPEERPDPGRRDPPPLLPPPDEPDDKGAKKPKDRMAKITDTMKKLGWINRAAAMIREARKRAG